MFRTSSVRTSLVALACWALAAGPAFAQSMTGSLTGTVVDASGAVVVDADITLVNEASRDVRRTKSNSDGYFAFAAVPSGTYTVAIETPGFSKYEQQGRDPEGGGQPLAAHDQAGRRRASPKTITVTAERRARAPQLGREERHPRPPSRS